MQHCEKFCLAKALLLLLLTIAVATTEAKPSKASTASSTRGSKIIKLSPPYIDSFTEEQEQTAVEEDRRGLCLVGPVGGTGGEIFSDKRNYLAGGEITAVKVNSGALLDSIKMKYGKNWAKSHGGSGGDTHSVTLDVDEYIIAVFGTAGGLINSIGFRTNKGRELGPWGGKGGDRFELKRKGLDCHLAYIEGQYGDVVDRLYFAFECANGCITESNKLCVFPFRYKEITFRGCTEMELPGKPWCSTATTTDDQYIKGKYGYCKMETCYQCKTNGGKKKGVPCVFPFKFKGITYNSCTEKGHPGKPWCATATTGNEHNFKSDYWGYCGKACPTEN